VSNDERVVSWHRDVLAAAAADADQHLSIGMPVTLADGCVDCPGRSHVECTQCSSNPRDVAGDDRVVMS